MSKRRVSRAYISECEFVSIESELWVCTCSTACVMCECREGCMSGTDRER